MKPPPPPLQARGLTRILSWRRLRVVFIAGFLVSLPMSADWQASYLVLIGRLLLIGLILLLVFGTLERHPARLPGWLARWALQVVGVAIAVPFAVMLAYSLTTIGDPGPWYRDEQRLSGFGFMTFLGMLVAPWIAMSALFRKISDRAQRLALTVELERSRFERNALDTRLRLLQSQVEPHFLFNTLANVRELVDSGSAQASAVLGSLIAYLRAAVPRLHDTRASLEQELELVQAYLQVMQMRMPDRLQYVVQVDDAALPLHCPSTSVLTLVENAVRHGIDPSEQGGRIEVRIGVADDRCRVQVIDTGVGLTQASEGLGTGLANLRERMHLAFADQAQLRLLPLQPHGVCAELEFPARIKPR